MARRRRTKRLRDLASGPGKLTRALGLTMRFYGGDLTRRGDLFISDPATAAELELSGLRESASAPEQIGSGAFSSKTAPMYRDGLGLRRRAGPRIPARRRFKTAASSARG